MDGEGDSEVTPEGEEDEQASEPTGGQNNAAPTESGESAEASGNIAGIPTWVVGSIAFFILAFILFSVPEVITGGNDP